MKIKMVNCGGDLHDLLSFADLVGKITKSRSGMRKRIESQLAKQGGEFQLWRALRTLADFAQSLSEMPVEVEAAEKVEKKHDAPAPPV